MNNEVKCVRSNEEVFPRAGYGAGISRRDWLAAMAMQGYVSNSAAKDDWSCEDVANLAYRIADAMIEESMK